MEANRVSIDIFSWCIAAEQLGKVPMNGLFRHAEMLSKLFIPSVILPANQNAPYRGIELVRAYLNVPIRLIYDAKQLSGEIWVSLGVDQCSPAALPRQALRVAILHDSMSAKGYFGAEALKRFCFGAENNEVFLCNSTYALESFKVDCVKLGIDLSCKKFLSYGCFHTLSALPNRQLEARVPNRSISVHSLFERKRFDLTLKLASELGFSHQHFGRLGDYVTRNDMQAFLAGYNNATWQEEATDSDLAEAYCTAEHFICMSEDEGFSMGALEAILYGVPYIHLSDIAAHREIYGRTDACFYPNTSKLKMHMITEEDRLRFFNRYSVRSITAEFRRFVDEY